MSRVIAVTHGKKHAGKNPGLTQEGFDQILGVAKLLREENLNFKVAVIATGQRFIDTAGILQEGIGYFAEKQVFSPLVGSGDSDTRDDDGNILILLQGGQTCSLNEYIGVSCNIEGWYPMSFVEGLLDQFIPNRDGDMLIVCGREFMGHETMMGQECQSAVAYELDSDDDVITVLGEDVVL